MYLQILALVLLAAGVLTVFSAKWVVGKYGLDKNAKCDFEHEMSEEELRQYKFNKAVVNMKMIGMLVVLPGIVLVLFAFK